MFRLPDNTATMSGEKRRILVVDDEPTLRLGFSYALANSSNHVETASTGRQALEKLNDSDYDIVILDLRMPDIDGLGVVDALRSNGNTTAVVLCSAALTPSAAFRAIQNGVPDFLLKPVRPTDLREVVDYVLDPPSDTISRLLVAARTGNLDAALQIAKEPDTHDHAIALWRNLLECLLEEQENDGPPAHERFPKSSLAEMAFRSR